MTDKIKTIPLNKKPSLVKGELAVQVPLHLSVPSRHSLIGQRLTGNKSSVCHLTKERLFDLVQLKAAHISTFAENRDAGLTVRVVPSPVHVHNLNLFEGQWWGGELKPLSSLDLGPLQMNGDAGCSCG